MFLELDRHQPGFTGRTGRIPPRPRPGCGNIRRKLYSRQADRGRRRRFRPRPNNAVCSTSAGLQYFLSRISLQNTVRHIKL